MAEALTAGSVFLCGICFSKSLRKFGEMDLVCFLVPRPCMWDLTPASPLPRSLSCGHNRESGRVLSILGNPGS